MSSLPPTSPKRRPRWGDRLPLISPRGLMYLSIASCCCLLVPAGAGLGDSSPTTWNAPAPPAASAPDLAARRAEFAARLARVQQQTQALQAQRLPTPPDWTMELDLLKWLDLTCAQRQFSAERKKALTSEATALRNDLAALRETGLNESPSDSFLVLDELQDTLHGERTRGQSIELEIDAALALLESAKQARSSCDKERRLLREALERRGQQGVTNTLARQHELMQLKCTALSEAVNQREEELELYRLEKQISDQKSERLQQRIARLQTSARFTAADLAEKLAALDQAEAELRKELEGVGRRLQDIDRRWLQTPSGTPMPTAPEATTATSQVTWNTARELPQEQLSLLNQTLQDLCVTRLGWRRRYELANGLASRDDLRQWIVEAQRFADRIQRRREAVELRAQEHRGELVALRGRAATGAAGSRDQQLVSMQIAELDRLVTCYGSTLLAIQANERFVRRFQGELGERVAPTSAEQWAVVAWGYCRDGWNYEITSVDDRPITLGKLVCGIVLLIVGFALARLGSRMVRRRVAPRLKLDEGAAAAVQTLVFYVLLCACTLFSLELIHLPLTVFTFMGGAIAIGIGFGSQNVLSNFISGLILLAERPVRAGDVVHIDGLTGVIDSIGARSTRMRTGSNLEIIVPNSKFLENNVTNWTLSDSHVRTMVSIGVAYGSCTRAVEQHLLQIVKSRPDVIPQPEPVVVFKDFGDNALLFEVHFWIDARSLMAGEIIRSEIRHTIDEVFRAHKIGIAYPQRDIHLDMQSPIQVQVRRLPEDLDRVQHLRAA